MILEKQYSKYIEFRLHEYFKPGDRVEVDYNNYVMNKRHITTISRTNYNASSSVETAAFNVIRDKNKMDMAQSKTRAWGKLLDDLIPTLSDLEQNYIAMKYDIGYMLPRIERELYMGKSAINEMRLEILYKITLEAARRKLIDIK